MRLLLILLLTSSAAQAIVWNTDQKVAPQTEPEGEMRNVARLHYTPLRIFGGCGVMLDDRWVLTAKHAVKLWIPNGLQVRVGDHHATAKRIIRHPDKNVDLALIELRKPLPGIKKLTRFAGQAEAGAHLWLGGFGKSGPAGQAGAPGKFAAGFNRLESVHDHRGKIVFDKGAKDEVLPTRFDSGSPVFIQVAKEWQLFGITVTATNSKNPNYGDRSHQQLIGPVRKWIEESRG